MRRLAVWFPYVAIVVLIICVYANSLGNSFHFDDLARGLETSGRRGEALQVYRDLLNSRSAPSSKEEGTRRMHLLQETTE